MKYVLFIDYHLYTMKSLNGSWNDGFYMKRSQKRTFKPLTVKKLAKVIAQYKIGQLPRPSFWLLLINKKARHAWAIAVCVCVYI